jgi:branched-chain amino acid transport system substrate-binding protein
MKIYYKYVFIGLVILGCILIIPLLSTKTDAVKIGYFSPQTGPAAISSEQMMNAFRLAHDIDPALSDGKKIDLFIEDDACDPKKALTAAKKLIEINKVDLLVSGVCGGSTVAVAPYAEQSKILLFTPVAATPKITDLGDYVFRTSGSGYKITEMVASEIKKLGFKKVAILFETAEYSTGWADAFATRFIDTEHSIVAKEGYGSKDSDLRTQLLKLVQSKPDIILVSPNSTVTANIFANQMNELGIKYPVVGNEYLMFKKVRENPNTNGFYASSYKFDMESELAINLLEKYKAKYGVYPDDEIYVALSYDGYNVIKGLFEKCKGKEVECLQREFYKIKDYQGVSGTISIDSNGDGIREFVLKKIENGNLIDLK